MLLAVLLLADGAERSRKGTAGGNLVALIALTDACGFRFPKICSQLPFPKWPIADGETGKVALKERPLLGARIASLNVRVWAFPVRPLSRPKAACRL